MRYMKFCEHRRENMWRWEKIHEGMERATEPVRVMKWGDAIPSEGRVARMVRNSG